MTYIYMTFGGKGLICKFEHGTLDSRRKLEGMFVFQAFFGSIDNHTHKFHNTVVFMHLLAPELGI
jgi:hypothetical protein